MAKAKTAVARTTKEEVAALNARLAACYDAKAIVKDAIRRMDVGPKGSLEFFQMRRVADYLQRQATETEASLPVEG